MGRQQMTGYERVMEAIAGKEYDVIPAINFTSVMNKEILNKTGISYDKANLDSYYMAKIAKASYEDMGFDTIAPYASVLLEASALGAKVQWTNGHYSPQVVEYAFHSVEDIKVPGDFLDKKEMKALLYAIKQLKKKYVHRAAIIGKVMGPWTLAYHLYGAEKLTLDIILKPQETKGMLEELSKVSLAFAKAQFEEGADIMVWAEHATRDIVSAKVYEEFILPIQCDAVKQLKQYGPIVLHVCGNVEDRMKSIKMAGFDCLHMDSRNNVMKIKEEAQDSIKLACCINNPVTLLRGDKQQIKREVINCISNGIPMIGPECAIPMNVPMRNLQYMSSLAHSYSYEQAKQMIRKVIKIQPKRCYNGVKD